VRQAETRKTGLQSREDTPLCDDSCEVSSSNIAQSDNLRFINTLCNVVACLENGTTNTMSSYSGAGTQTKTNSKAEPEKNQLGTGICNYGNYSDQGDAEPAHWLGVSASC